MLISEGIPGSTPFSFIDTDYYFDPYSYASLNLASQNLTALLNATTLLSVTQNAFSTFFQWFVSSPNGATNESWAYQKIDARLPPDLDVVSYDNVTVVTITAAVAITRRLTTEPNATRE